MIPAVRGTAMTALAVAKKLTALSGNQPLPPERLHPALYLCQGWFLAWYGRPLFDEPILAAADGPRVPGVDGHDPSAAPDLPKAGRESVKQVWDHFGSYTAERLAEAVRESSPWKSRRGTDEPIPTDEMLAHFGADFERQTGEERGVMGQYERDLAAGNFVRLEDILREDAA